VACPSSNKLELFFINLLSRVARFLLGAWYQNWKKCTKWIQDVPNCHKISQISQKIQMAIKYINIFQRKALQNLLKMGFLVWKQTIWKPCYKASTPSSQLPAPSSQLPAPSSQFRHFFHCFDLDDYLGTQI
jgi:hypothetical protein